jgi:hypothetical protein
METFWIVPDFVRALNEATSENGLNCQDVELRLRVE